MRSPHQSALLRTYAAPPGRAWPRGVGGLARVLVAAGLTLLGLAAAVVLSRAQNGPTEYEVKAALLYNFGVFTEWPASAFEGPASPFVVGVVGDNPFGDALAHTLAGKRIGAHPVALRLFRRPEDVSDCHILFVAASERSRLDRVRAALGDAPTLTVGDMDGFADGPGMIGLSLEGGRVRMAVNRANVARAHLVISSRLLALARIVDGDRP
ncbi:MAG TPA: YfiR family protein [Candidatus Eisenbacteria bacterium]|nr:YfiR family protein [Candidatus Eisenbacteria bacterium]